VGGSRPTTWHASDEEWEEGFTLNFERHRQLTQQLLQHMVEPRGGRIINICGSIELRQVNTAAAAKAALVVWSKGLSHELGKYGITVNYIEPGLIDTAQIRRLFPSDARRQYAEQHISLGDFGEPEDVGAATAFLAFGPAAYHWHRSRCRRRYAIPLVLSAEGRDLHLPFGPSTTALLCRGGRSL
jgi:3-oxoacyl-[acyl-carrier protein] reductase